jgi:hypothetical protein
MLLLISKDFLLSIHTPFLFPYFLTFSQVESLSANAIVLYFVNHYKEFQGGYSELRRAYSILVSKDALNREEDTYQKGY